MKKIITITLNFLLAVLLLTSCGIKSKTTNTIQSMELTEQQLEITELLGGSQEFLLFEFNTTEKYESIDVWIDIYENGVLAEKGLNGVSMSSDEPKIFDGKLAITINNAFGYQWMFSLSIGDGIGSSSTTSPLVPIDTGAANAFGPINETVSIEKGKEIVIYSSLFSFGNISTGGNKQDYIKNPELLSPYIVSYLIKCKFS